MRPAWSLGVFEVCGTRADSRCVLGHQALGQAFGGKVVRAQTLMHGQNFADRGTRG